MPTADPWLKYQNSVAGFLHVGTASLLQIPNVLQELLWNDPVLGRGYSWRGFANIHPTWSDVWEPQGGSAMDEAYGLFLWNLAVPLTDPSLQADADRVSKEIADVNKEQTQLTKEMMQAWKEFSEAQRDMPPEFQTTFEDWRNQNYADAFTHLNQKRDNLGVEYGHFAGLAGAGWQDVTAARDDFDRGRSDEFTPAFQTDIAFLEGPPPTPPAPPAHPAVVHAHTYAFQPDMATFINEAQSGQGTQLHMAMDQFTATSHDEQWSAGGGAGFDVGFFSFGASAGASHEEFDSSSSDFKMSITAPSFASLQVLPGPWFHRNVITAHPDGPYLAAGPAAVQKRNFFFGPTGILNVIPAMAYVAYQPEISVSLAESDYHRVEDQWNANASFGIGPFSFGGGASSSSSDVTFNAASRTFVAKSHSPHAQLFAVRVDVLP